MKFRVLPGGSPCPASIAPYWARVEHKAGVYDSSAYRGDDPAARPILHAHGKHTQRELSEAAPAQRAAWGVTGNPNRPGTGTHELRSDGHARKGPPGRKLAEWQQPVDLGPNTPGNVKLIEQAAHACGWPVEFPYPSGNEMHHCQFVTRPRPKNPVQFAHIVRERARMPRK